MLVSAELSEDLVNSLDLGLRIIVLQLQDAAIEVQLVVGKLSAKWRMQVPSR